MTDTISIEKTIEHLLTKPVESQKIIDPTPIPWQLKIIRLAFATLGPLFPEKASKLAFNFFSTPRRRARHKQNDQLIDVAVVSNIIVNGNNIKTYEWGSGKSTVLLVHGWESRGTALRAYVPNLLRAGFRVIAFDAPAHGDSDGKQTNLRSFSAVIQAIIQQNNSIYGLIAHSFGGPSSMYAFKQMSAEFSIPKFVMVACPSAIIVPVQLAITMMNLPKAVSDKFINRLEKELELPIEQITIPNFASTVNVGEVLIVHDIHDATVPIDSAIANSKAFQQSQLITTEGLGHNIILKDKQVIKRITDFIAG